VKTVYLESVCEINIGKTPSRSEPRYWGEGQPWLSIADMNQGSKIQTTKEQITDIAVIETGIKQVKSGTVLYSFKLSIGKIGIAKKDLYTNEAIAALPIKNLNELDSKYLIYALGQMKFGETSDRAAMGMTLNKKKLAKLKIPLPPLPEQKRIAAILDKADELRQKRRQAIAKLDELLQATFLDMFGDPVTNPKGWEVKKITQMVKNEKHSIKRGPFGGALKKEIFKPSGYLVYEQYHALNNDFNMERYYIDDVKFNELKAFEVKSKDLIISCSGVYLGKLAEIPEGNTKGIINQALLKVSLNEDIMKNILFKFIFTNKRFRSTFFGDQRGSGVPNFPPMTTFKQFDFICPPIDIQNRFIVLVQSIQRNLAKQKDGLLKAENLFSSLQQRAFKGQL
jgi:type I restriction enzyme S subunit